MINIKVDNTGKVTGDTNSVVGYDNQIESNTVHILHPNKSNVLHKVVYQEYGTECHQYLDANDEVKLKIFGNGVIKIQYVQEDASSLNAVWSSEIFELVVNKAISPILPDFTCRPIYPPHCCGIIDISDTTITNNCKLSDRLESIENKLNSLNELTDRVDNLASKINQEINDRCESDDSIKSTLDELSEKVNSIVG